MSCQYGRGISGGDIPDKEVIRCYSQLWYLLFVAVCWSAARANFRTIFSVKKHLVRQSKFPVLTLYFAVDLQRGRPLLSCLCITSLRPIDRQPIHSRCVFSGYGIVGVSWTGRESPLVNSALLHDRIETFHRGVRWLQWALGILSNELLIYHRNLGQDRTTRVAAERIFALAVFTNREIARWSVLKFPGSM